MYQSIDRYIMVTSIAGNLYCQATAKSCMFPFCQRFHKNEANFVFTKHALVWFQETTVHSIDIDAIAVFLNPLSSYTYQSLSKFIKIWCYQVNNHLQGIPFDPFKALYRGTEVSCVTLETCYNGHPLLRVD